MTIVEATLVLGVFLLLLMGIFEYCRFLLVLHVTTNAARDGARYASVNTNKPTNFDTVDYTDASGNVYPSIAKYTTTRMGTVDANVPGFAVSVFACDMTALNQTPPVIQAKTGTTWNQVQFGQKIAVNVTGTYKPITPVFLMMPSSIPINVTAVMNSEG
jgi:Flp pilus assembly protein TadG